jgi:hypothetical protein
VKRLLDALRRAATEPAFVRPAGLGAGRGETDARALTRRLVLGFGRLLEA